MSDGMEVKRYFIFLAYKGTHYCGWQIQPNGISIQQCIEEALSTVLRQATTVTGAGRTDAGVHARMMVAHFDVSLDGMATLSDDHAITNRLNNLLPNDIAVDKIVPVTNDAHARFDALSRTYIYMLTDRKNPFHYETVCRMPLRSVNFEKMNDACAVLYDYSDFTSFSKLHSDVKTHHCRIFEAGWTQSEDVWIFTIKADRFLRNMVRAIVGTLLDVGREKLTINDLKNIIEAKNRCKAGMSIAPEGLALAGIDYPDHIFISKKM